jgi:hypothetical protein
VPGLGSVTESYTVYDDQTNPSCRRTTWTPVVLTVAGKGEIDVSLVESTPCDQNAVGAAKFTITGGAGRFTGASGNGTEDAGNFISDRWIGTLTAPGVQFDTTAPTIHGAASKTVRLRRGATRVRVTYKVTAQDAVDGPVPVTCTPRSGSRFKLGRTTVTCTATDSSANTATAHFTIIVKRR